MHNIITDNKKAALIEICGSHDECLYSQASFLKDAGYKVSLIISDNLFERVKDYDNIHDLISIKFTDKRLNDLKNLFQIRKYIKSNQIRYVILNTASNEIIAKLVHLLPNNVKIAGTIHSLKKLTSGLSQRLINSKVRKYFVLNDYLLDFVPELRDTSFDSYYSIFYKECNIDIEKPKADFWVAVPGHIEFKRRDYEGLIRELDNYNISSNIKFLILGNSKSNYSDAPKMNKMMEGKPYYNNFIFFDEFIPSNKLYAMLRRSDIILPLLNPGVDYYPDYLSNQISGTFNLSFGLKIPMLLHQDFSGIDDFVHSSFFYESGSMIRKLNNLYENPELIDKKRSKLMNYPKFKYELNAKKYIIFLEG